MDRDVKKFQQAQDKVRKMVAERVDEKLVVEAENAMNQVDTYTRFQRALTMVLENKTTDAGIIVDALKADPIRRRFMILYDYNEDYAYARIKFGEASEIGIGRASYLTATDGTTFLNLLKKKVATLLDPLLL